MNLEVVNIQIDGEYVNEVIWVKSGETSIHTGMSLTTPLNLKVDEYSLENPGETSIITVKTDKDVYKQIELIRCTPGCECDIFDINIDDENDKFLPYEGGTISFTYSLKDEFKNTCDIKTITCYTKSNFVSVYKDLSNNKFIATFEENYVSKRKARIIFSYAGINCQVFTISQAAKVESCNQRIRIASQNGEKEVECNGGSVQFVIKEVPVPSCNEKITVSAEGGVTIVSCEGGVRVQFTHGESPSPEPPKPINPCNSAITITTTAEKIKQAGETILFEIEQIDEFDILLNQFNNVLISRNKTKISLNETPLIYSYLKLGYNRAIEEYNGSSPLFTESNYDEIYNYRGTNTQYKNTAKNAMLSWLMAMQLSEIYADSGKTTNTQTELFKKAYEIGGGRSVPVYNNNDIHSDVFIARYAASAMYAIKRSEKSFSDMDNLRNEVQEAPIDRNSSWTDSGQITEATCDGHYDSSNSIGYALNLNDIFPNAAGPYADNFYNGGLICKTVASRTPDQLQPSNQFNSTTHNYLIDEQIDNIVTSYYNLSANDRDLTRTVQAVADDEDDINQMLGGITYYKYNTSNPKTSFTVGTPSDNNGSFHGTFNCNVLGKDLSSLISNTNDTETVIAYFFSGVGYIGGHSRQTILDPQYGRRRPGQGEGDALYNGDTVVLTSTPRCLCNSGCNTNLNYLVDTSITRLVGGGTKLNSNHYYYVDNNGDGEQDSGEPYYGDGIAGATNECAGLHASTYPSGHSSEVWTVALFLMQMLPSRYAEIYKAAYDYTVSRTIVRAHWNSDTMYGKLVATTMVPVMNKFRSAHNGQNFRTFYEAAKLMIDNAPNC